MAQADIKRQVRRPSLTGRKNPDGSIKEYTVTIFVDGTADCTCPNYYIGTKDALYRCKHIERELKEGGRAKKDMPSPASRPTEATTPAIDILGDITIAPRSRRGR